MSGSRIPLPEVLSSEIAYHGFFDLKVDLLQYPRGVRRPYTSLATGCDAAAILAETEEGLFILNKEYRHPAKHWLLSCPGGRIDPGESPIDGARRELLEETGYIAEEWVAVGTIYPLPALCDQRIHFVFAKRAKKIQPPQLEPTELIETTLKSRKEILEEISSGFPIDGILCTALFLHHGKH